LRNGDVTRLHKDGASGAVHVERLGDVTSPART
jgi:hypothetical protein